MGKPASQILARILRETRRIGEKSLHIFSAALDALRRNYNKLAHGDIRWETKSRNALLIVNRSLKNRFTWVTNAGDWVVDVFLRLKIRVKLSLLVGLSIAIVTFIISSIALNIQERELRLQTHVLGTNIVQSLSAVAEDNLLLNSIPVLQDYVKNFGKRRIPGLEHLFVMDRTGKVVAALESDSINTMVSRADWDVLASADSAIQIETESQFRFVQTIFVVKHENQKEKRILVGSSSVSFSKAVLEAPIAEMKQRIILLSFLVSCVAIYFVYVLSQKFVHVIIVLSEAARRVGSGDLKVSVVTRNKDEVGALAREFNFMVLQIREKTEMTKFISRSTAQMISGGKEATLGGTRRVITAMFTDIRNFTTVSENRWPEEVVETLNHYLDLQTRVIHSHEGVVDKFLGDGIMSVFTGDKMVPNAIAAAISLQKEVAKLNEDRKKNNELVLEVGVGIATGVAVLGSIGSSDRMDYTAIGDTVNLASRLCSIAGPAEIIVTEDVVKRLGPNKSLAQSGGKVPIKGKHDRVPIYQISYSLS